MNSKERVRAAVCRKKPDKAPVNFEATDAAWEKLLKFHGLSDREELYRKYEIDIREIAPAYIGPELEQYEKDGAKYYKTPHGYWMKEQWTGKEFKKTQKNSQRWHINTVAFTNSIPAVR